MPLTRPLILRHAGARQESYTPALLDVAQDHLLHLLHLSEVFKRPGVVFKGGTSLRKCRIGHQGRFSTDIDLAVPDDDDVVDICEIVNGAAIGGFRFALSSPSDDARTWKLDVHHTGLGDIKGIARIECARRRVCLPPESLPLLHLPIHDRYDFYRPQSPSLLRPKLVRKSWRAIDACRSLVTSTTSRGLRRARCRRRW